jgi:hypothetical protein
MTAFSLIPPFFGAILGGLLGYLLSWVFDVNAFLCIAIGGYSSVLLLLAAYYRLKSKITNPYYRSHPITWQEIRFGVSFYLVIATVGLFFIVIWPLKSELQKLREQREQQHPPKSAGFHLPMRSPTGPMTPTGAQALGVVMSWCKRM